MKPTGRAQSAAAQRAANKDTACAAAGLRGHGRAGRRRAWSVESKVEVGTSSLPAEVELSYQWKRFSGLS
jgi:hypothetical protein